MLDSDLLIVDCLSEGKALSLESVSRVAQGLEFLSSSDTNISSTRVAFGLVREYREELHRVLASMQVMYEATGSGIYSYSQHGIRAALQLLDVMVSDPLFEATLELAQGEA